MMPGKKVVQSKVVRFPDFRLSAETTPEFLCFEKTLGFGGLESRRF